MKIRKSKDDRELYIFGEGFHYGDLNKAGKMDLWKIAKHFETGGAASFMHGFAGIIDAGVVSAFIRFQTMELSPEFHANADVCSPWMMRVRLFYLGRTSYWLEYATFCQRTGMQLGRNLLQGVRIDRDTRRPVPLPEEAVALHKKSQTKPEEVPPRFTFPDTRPDPERSFKLSTKALPSETDSNQHVNQAACFKYCTDCASLAAMQGGVLQKFSRDMAYYNAKTFSVEYVGEMLAGDVLDVLCWEDPRDPCVVHFLVKIGEKVTCRCRGEWFADSNGNPIELLKKAIPDAAVSKM